MNGIILDLFAGEGGATAGYQRAGYEVIAVDTDKRRLRYNPTKYHTVGDAMVVLRALASGADIYAVARDGSLHAFGWQHIALVHMSPPCQGYSRGNAGKITSWPRLIGPCRNLATEVRIPYVIENVNDAAPYMRDPHVLCGCHFDLHTADTDGETIYMQRPRLFETSFPTPPNAPHRHEHMKWVAGAYGGARRDKHEAKYVRKGGYVPASKTVLQHLMGLDHAMTWRGIFESIPPCYTERIGNIFRTPHNV